MNIKYIVLEKIHVTGADGLCNDDCGCGNVDDDLFCCCNSMDGFLDCVLAKSVLIKEHCKPDDCDGCNVSCDGYGEACITDAKMYVPLTVKGETK